MKKIVSIFLLCFLLILTACTPGRIPHEVRDEPTSEEFRVLAESLRESTVAVLGQYMVFNTGIGSGLIFMKETIDDEFAYYYVVTNQHVVEGNSRVTIRTTKRDELGDIYAEDESLSKDYEDIAIVRFKSDLEYPIVKIIPFEEKNTHVQVSVGQTVFGIGTPVSTNNYNLVTNLGIISALDTYFISHTANINPGNSGGPLFSYDGTFIGISTQRIEVFNGQTVYLMGESISVNQVSFMIKKLLDRVTPKLGVYLLEMNDFLTNDYLLYFKEQAANFKPEELVDPNEVGVVIIDVNVTRPSYGILKQFDVILSVNGTRVTTSEHLISAASPIKSGNQYTFEVRRKNIDTNQFETLTIEVEIP
ncbi:MAG TPA: trypsin-like peptidase domain-containing protein [Acholeplasma sp.]|nr:trypsin-like peptidase domain-containing protein [Acholeplasma sp.]